MLLKKDLIKELGEEYAPMINQISIADFTKCVAYWSGLDINEVSNSAIMDYLKKWAVNKKHFFELLGNKTRVDTQITYENQRCEDFEAKYEELAMEYPIYAPWFSGLGYPQQNKINHYYNITWEIRDFCKKYFPHYSMEGSTVTHFFKKCLKAPEEVINKIASIYEFDVVTSNFTISIDPVDMMLASENPYNWKSCYRLDPSNDASHADGCLAAVLDSTSLITYAWSKAGEYAFEDSPYNLKNVRYKRMREWISINSTLDAIHFNMIYPGKWNYPRDFIANWRDKVETYVANYLKKENLWKKNDAFEYDCDRVNWYGYGEWSGDNIYYLKDSDKQITEKIFYAYNEEIVCPCGCGTILPPSDVDWDEIEEVYRGGGFCCRNYEENYEDCDEDDWDDDEDYEEEEEYDADQQLIEREEATDAEASS